MRYGYRDVWHDKTVQGSYCRAFTRSAWTRLRVASARQAQRGVHNICEVPSSIFLLLGADHSYNGSRSRVAGSGSVAWVGFDNDHLAAVATNDWARFSYRACGNNSDVVWDVIRRVAAITRIA
jgi:hypothetical protein